MNSREKILAAVAQNQPPNVDLPDINLFNNAGGPDSLDKFAAVLSGIGGKVFYINNFTEIGAIITGKLGIQGRIINLVKGLNLNNAEVVIKDVAVHSLHDVELAIVKAHFGVAENGAVWVTEDDMEQRALPFISQHLAVVIQQDQIVPTMHQAYGLVNNLSYGCFIAGPSKTADIEQSLVIGAHGPKSMTVFVLVS
ncbi:MAG TPA: LUD domain-containing protein [Mucilaginibacter sp.]